MQNEELNQAVFTYNNYLERVTTAVQHFCEDLQDSDYQELSMVLPSIVEGFQWISEAAGKFAGLGKLGAESLDKYRELLADIVEAMENKDNILLHDLFEFEMLEILNELRIAYC